MNLSLNIDGRLVTTQVSDREILAGVIQAEKRLTRQDIAAMYQVHINTVDAWMRENLIPYFKIGGAVRFDLADVKAAEKNFKQEAI